MNNPSDVSADGPKNNDTIYIKETPVNASIVYK
jgi:hypothetical protein